MRSIVITLTEQQEKKLRKIKQALEPATPKPRMSIGQVLFKGHIQSGGKLRRTKLILGVVENAPALKIVSVVEKNAINL